MHSECAPRHTGRSGSCGKKMLALSSERGTAPPTPAKCARLIWIIEADLLPIRQRQPKYDVGGIYHPGTLGTSDGEEGELDVTEAPTVADVAAEALCENDDGTIQTKLQSKAGSRSAAAEN
eukprot:4117057-Pleurochrysis_carterae.AAC.2